MTTKNELQNALKEKFSINKNISQPLSKEECERLITLLCSEPSATKLVMSYAEKNSSLGLNNTKFGNERSRIEQKFEVLQAEYFQLEKNIGNLEETTTALESKKKLLKEEQIKLEVEVQKLSLNNQTLTSEIKNLSLNNQALTSEIKNLNTQNNELSEANTQLKKENKDLKNIVDRIRLRLASDTKLLLQYEDSEIRKALIRLFRWTLG